VLARARARVQRCLEHTIRAAAEIADDSETVAIEAALTQNASASFRFLRGSRSQPHDYVCSTRRKTGRGRRTT